MTLRQVIKKGPKANVFQRFAAGKCRIKFFEKKVELMVDKSAGSGYNNQAVFPKEQRFAAVLELVDRPA